MTVLKDLQQLEQHIIKRAAELRGAVEEYAELREAASKLGIDLDAANRRGATPTTAKRKPAARGAKPKRRTNARTKPVPGGSRQGGSRRDDVLRLVKQQPGITVAELGTKLNVNSTGLYRVVRQLEQSGEVKKDGTALAPTAG